MSRWLSVATLFAAAGGILYEIYLGAFGSYLFGDSIKVFSLTTGIYMFSMGVGAFLIRPMIARPMRRLMEIELALAFLHLVSPLAIWILFTQGWGANFLFWKVLIASGVLVGTEVPLLLALAREQEGTSDQQVHRVLAADYLGALLASLVFGFWLLPHLGLVASASFSSLLELMAFGVLWLGPAEFRKYRGRWLGGAGFILAAVAVTVFLFSGKIQTALEERWVQDSFGAQLLHSEWTGHNYISLIDTPISGASKREKVLLLNGQVQWATGDYIFAYHELLVVPPAELFQVRTGRPPKRILVLGGGDGFVAERFRKLYGSPEITMIEIDYRIPLLAVQTPYWRDSGGGVLKEPGVEVKIADAYARIMEGKEVGPFDVIVLDLPVAHHPGLARFYTASFFSRLSRILHEDGVVSIQSSARALRPFGRERFVCHLESLLHRVGMAAATLVGKDQDFYTVGQRGGLEWPSVGDTLPGKHLSSGGKLAMYRQDPWNRFGDRCQPVAQNSLLRPTLLEF